MYPLLEVNKKHLRKNIIELKRLCDEKNIDITGISKVFTCEPEIIQILIDNGIKKIGDSRIENLKKIKNIPIEKWLIRMPMLSEIDELIENVDVSLNSEIEVIRKISKIASEKRKIHKVILMVDLGDLREGYIDYHELILVAKEVEKMQGVHLYGIGVNLTCFSFVQPDKSKMQELVNLSKIIEKEIGRNLEVISGGNSATINLMLEGEIPREVNNLRLGEGILFGKERATYKLLPNTYDDVFILKTEIIEVKEKPSLPFGKIGKDSYGNTPSFFNRGVRKKAICALGKQDFDVETTSPLDKNIEILGASSDHLMLDITECSKEYGVGDIIEFKLGYFSTMRVFTSNYVKKIYK